MKTQRLKSITKKDITSAFKTSAPIMVTFVILGAGFGIMMEQHGYGPLWSFFSGIIIFSGTVQFLSVSMLASGSIIMSALTAFMVAARHVFFSISMIGRYKEEGKKKWYLYYALCDETYAMLSRDEIPFDVNISNYRLFVTLFDQASWILGSVLGGCLGTLLNFDSTGIDFSMTALFTTVYIEQWLNSKCHIPAVLGVMRPFVENGKLLPRTEKDLFSRLGDYVVYELDGGVHACAALHIYEDGQAEIAAVAVDQTFAHMGIGPKLIAQLIKNAREKKVSSIFIMTTQAADWFEKLGFVQDSVESLPQERRAIWTKERNSKVYRLSHQVGQ